jgi:uncharacterized membrane protein YjjP (DUF1212 family)
MLYIASGLVIFVILSIIIRVIPHVINDPTPGAAPENSVAALWVIAGIQLIILAVLIGKIALSHRYRRLNQTGLSIPGIILILTGLPLLDAGGAYQDYNSDMSGMAFLLATCVLFDMLAGIIAIILPSGIPDNPDKR